MSKKRIWVEGALFFVVGAILYLLFAKEFGYYNDDWYTMYAARVAGADIFHEIYSIDRPGRAYVMIPLYLLFKGQPFFYSLSAYLFRVAGALAFLWLLRLLWEERKNETLLAAFLFLIYPGFLDMPIAIDFQSHLIGVLMAFLSLGLMVNAISADKLWAKALFWIGSVLLGWGYLSQMEYYIGFEGIRLAIIVLLLRRGNVSLNKLAKDTLVRWLPYAIVPSGFLFWRLFIFENDRAVTDTSAQLEKLVSSTLPTLYAWSINFVESFVNVLFLAWGDSLARLAFSLDLQRALRGMLLAFILAGFVSISFYFLRKVEHETGDENLWGRESLGLGVAWLVLGLFPVILANRSVHLAEYSRYGFVSAGGAMLVLAYLLGQLKRASVQGMVLAFLIFSASFTHYGNSVSYADSFAAMREFWWQVSWRVPQFELRTTLIASYPGSVRETSFVWGPANQIYYPELLEGKGVQTGVYALMMNDRTAMNVLTRQKAKLDKYNVVETYPSARNILILSQPTENSCVQVIEGDAPHYSPYEKGNVMLLGAYSETERILLDAPLHYPPSFLFGPEPAHDWCYIYQKATLARQRGDWDEVYALDAEASRKGSAPQDSIEWMPFLQASAILGDSERVVTIAPFIISSPFIAQQACQILSGEELSPEMHNLVKELYCFEQ